MTWYNLAVLRAQQTWRCGKQYSHKAVEETGGGLIALVPCAIAVLVIALLRGAEPPVGRAHLLEPDLGLLNLVGVLVGVPVATKGAVCADGLAAWVLGIARLWRGLGNRPLVPVVRWLSGAEGTADRQREL